MADLARQASFGRQRRRLGAPRRRLGRRHRRRDIDSSLWRAPIERAGDAVPARVDGGHGSYGALPVEASTAPGVCCPHLFRQIPSRPADGVLASAEAGAQPSPIRTPERLPRRLARPELDNAVFASVLHVAS